MSKGKKASAVHKNAAEKPSRRLTDKQEKFVQNVLSGMTHIEAYRDAYPGGRSSDAVVAKNASALLKKPHVQRRYEELLDKVRKEGERRGVMSAAEVLERLSEIASSVKEDDQPAKLSAAVKCLELLGKHHSLFTEKHEVQGVQAVIEVKGYEDE